MVATQRCQKCGAEKPLTDFNWANKERGARQKMCRECFSAYNRQRYEQKRQQILDQVNKYRTENRDRINAARKAAYWSDPEESRRRARSYAAVLNAKPERKAAKQAWATADRAANPEKYRARTRRMYANNPEGHRQKTQRHRARKHASTVADITPSMLAAKWAYWGGKCWMCGGEAVEWDHVKPLAKGGSHCLSNLRPACRSCNAQKSAAWPVLHLLRAA